MSGGGSFWHRLRMRLGGDDAMLAQISDLVQKQIDANADVQEVTEESILNPIIIAPSKMVLRDNLFKVIGNSITEGLIAYLPIDPDLDKMRLWVQNEHGGRYLTDHSFMGNKIQLNGGDQSKLIWSTIDDGVEGSGIVNQLIDDQYVRVEDKDSSPNPNVRIKEIAATAEGITAFIRLFVQRNENPDKPGVLFSKIDTEQVDFAYGAYLKTDGALIWFVRDTGREYVLTTDADALVYTGTNLPDFTDTDYHPSDFHTVSTIDAVPDPIPFTDLAFTFKFSDKRMQIIKSTFDQPVVVIADSTSNPESTGLVGHWRLNEGGDIGNTPDAPSSYTKTVYNAVTTGNNGTITNATWTADSLLSFDGTGDSVSVSGYTAIDTLSAMTISFWYYPRTDAHTTNLIAKGTGNSSFLISHNTGDDISFNVTNSGATAQTATATDSMVNLNEWHHIVGRWTAGGPVKINVNNGSVVNSSNLTGSVTNAGEALIIGDTGASAPDGLIHDVKIWNRGLSDAEVTTLYGAGRAITYLPKWEANPPTEPPPPGPVVNPFVNVYNVPLPAAGEQDLVRLHAITASSLTERYNVGQGAQENPPAVPDEGEYTNDPTYDAGTAVQETPSLYAQHSTTPIASTRLSLSKDFFGGEKFLTGSDVIGKPITKVVTKLCDHNPSAAPATGNVVAKIITAGGTLKSTSNTVDAATLADNLNATSTSAWTAVTFTFSGNTWDMANGDRVQFEYDQGGTGGAPGPEVLSGYEMISVSGYNGSWYADLNSWTEQIVDNTSSDLYNKVISRVRVAIAKGNAASYSTTCFAQIISGGNVVAQSGGFNPGTLATFYPQFYAQDLTFTNPTYAMQVGDSIRIVYNWGGPSGSGYIRVAGLSPGSESNSHSRDNNQGTITNHTGDDVTMDVYVRTPGATKSVALPSTASSVESNSNQYDAPWSTGTITDRTSSDVLMDVYFDAATGSPNHQYTALRLDANKFVAEYITSTSSPIYNQKLTKIAVRINRVGTPTGTLFCRIKKASDSSTITFGLNGVAGTGLTTFSTTLGTASNPATTFTFENDANGDDVTGYALQVGDRVMFELSGGTSNSTNYVQVARTTTASTVAGSELQTSTAGTTWTSSTNDDIIGNMYSGGFLPPSIFPYHTLGYVNTRVAQKVTSTTASAGNIYNQRVTQVKPWLKRIGSPSGTINVVIRNSSDVIQASINTFDASSVSNVDFTQYTFTNLNQTYTMTLNDRISVEFSGGDINNHIQINTNLLNTYPYGNLETFSGSSYTTRTSHDMAGIMSSGGGATDPLARTRVGEKVATTDSAIKFKKISRIKVYMKRTVSPTGNVTFRIRNSADAIVATIGTKDAATIDPNTPTAYTITSSPISAYALQVGDHVSVEYNAGDDFNFVEIMTSKTTDVFDGVTKTYLSKYDDINWVPNTAIDLIGELWEGGDTYTPSQEDVLIPPPKYTKDLTVLAGGYPWTWINHDLLSSEYAVSQLFVNAIMPDFRFYRKVLTVAELTNINTNRTDRAAIAKGEVSKFAYSFISED